MLHGSSNNDIRNLHGRCFRLVYNGKISSYDGSIDGITEDGSLCLHHRNMQTFATKMFKIKSLI